MAREVCRSWYCAREDLRATLVVYRRLGKTLELIERNVVRGRSGSMGGHSLWEEASEKGLEVE